MQLQTPEPAVTPTPPPDEGGVHPGQAAPAADVAVTARMADGPGGASGPPWRTSPWLPWVAAVAAVLALGPLLAVIARRLWDTTYYQHAPFVFAAAAFLAWRRTRGRPPAGRRPSLVTSVSLWAFTLPVCAAGVLLDTPWGALVGALFGVLAAVHTIGGPSLTGRVLPCWALCWLVVPLPFGFDQRLVVGLQALATRSASAGLDLIGYRHLVAGTTVEMPGKSYFVEEACSGINSLYAAMACVAIYLVWNDRGLFRALAILAAAVVWVLAANVVRVAAVVVLVHRFDLPVAEGLGHDLLGALVFAAAILLSLSTDRMLLFVAPEHRLSLANLVRLWRKPDSATAVAYDAYGRDADPSGSRSLPAARSARRGPLWIAVAAAFLLLAGVRFALPGSAPAVPVVADADLRLKPMPADALPATWNGWQQVDFRTTERGRDDRDGQFSRTWFYRKGRLTAAVSMDGPFRDGWHDLQICYTATGWSCDEVTDSRDEARGDGGVHTALQMEKPGGRNGLVLFTSHALADDAPLGPPETYRIAATRRFAALRSLWERASEGVGRRVGPEPGYQIQTFVDSYLPLSTDEEEDVEAFFQEMRGRITAWSAADEA